MLSRNLFREIVEDPRKIHKVVQLNECYRMIPELLDFHKQFYESLVAHKSCVDIHMELQITEKAFWDAHVRPTLSGSRPQICIDVTGEEITHTKSHGTTTKHNSAEAKVIAYTIKRMLEFEPPVGGSKIKPWDIGVVSPYTGQVLEVRKELRKIGVDPSLFLISSVQHAQGKQRNIAFVSLVVNIGSLRPGIKDYVLISFVGDGNNINVALSRQRIGRHLVGGLQCLVQMATDSHKDALRDWPLFGLLRQLAENDCIIAADEWAHVMNNDGQKPIDGPWALGQNFRRKIIAPFGAPSGMGVARDRPAPIPFGDNTFAFTSSSNVTNKNIRPEPENVQFSGLGDIDPDQKQTGGKGKGKGKGSGKGSGKGPDKGGRGGTGGSAPLSTG